MKITYELEKTLSLFSPEEREYAYALVSGFAEPPVSIEVFIKDPYFLGSIFKDVEFYPFWMERFKEIYPSPVFPSPYKECIFTGSIGTGKTTSGLIGILYSIHRLLCLDSPHVVFRLTPNTDIWFVLFTLTLDLVYDVLWNTLNEMLWDSPYFESMGINVDSKHSIPVIQLPHRIGISAASRASHTLGKAVFGGILDETNFGFSKSSGNQKVYDVYTSVLRRMESRFFKSPGQLYIISSKRDESDFLETHIREARENNITTTYIVDACLWEVKRGVFPYSGEVFKVFVGSNTRSPCIVSPGEEEKYSSEHIIEVPIEHREAFVKDIVSALRDVAGYSSISRFKFITNTNLLMKSFQVVNATTRDYIRVSFDGSDRIIDYLDMNILKANLIRNPLSPRVIHLDLATSNDAYGFAMGTVPYLVNISRKDMISPDVDVSTVEPFVIIELVFGVVKGDQFEIPLFKVREFILELSNMGFPIVLVTADSWQSRDTLQLLKLKGYDTRIISVDRDKLAYFSLRNAIYEERIHLPQHPVLMRELNELREFEDRIDHLEMFSKDLADAVAGVTFVLLEEFRSGSFEQFAPSLESGGLLDNKDVDYMIRTFEDRYNIVLG